MDTNNYEIVLTDIAKEELEEIYEYISEHLLEPIAANRLMNKIEQNILRLEQNPYSCVEVHIKPHNEVYRKLVIDNYIALYEVDKLDCVPLYIVYSSYFSFIHSSQVNILFSGFLEHTPFTSW